MKFLYKIFLKFYVSIWAILNSRALLKYSFERYVGFYYLPNDIENQTKIDGTKLFKKKSFRLINELNKKIYDQSK